MPIDVSRIIDIAVFFAQDLGKSQNGNDRAGLLTGQLNEAQALFSDANAELGRFKNLLWAMTLSRLVFIEMWTNYTLLELYAKMLSML